MKKKFVVLVVIGLLPLVFIAGYFVGNRPSVLDAAYSKGEITINTISTKNLRRGERLAMAYGIRHGRAAGMAQCARMEFEKVDGARKDISEYYEPALKCVKDSWTIMHSGEEQEKKGFTFLGGAMFEAMENRESE